MEFRNDPGELISQLDSAWEVYSSEFDKQIQECLASVVSWKWATDAMFRSHPLFGHADTTPRHEPWRPFTRNWITDEDPKANLEHGWKHGLTSKDGSFSRRGSGMATPCFGEMMAATD